MREGEGGRGREREGEGGRGREREWGSGREGWVVRGIGVTEAVGFWQSRDEVMAGVIARQRPTYTAERGAGHTRLQTGGITPERRAQQPQSSTTECVR